MVSPYRPQEQVLTPPDSRVMVKVYEILIQANLSDNRRRLRQFWLPDRSGADGLRRRSRRSSTEIGLVRKRAIENKCIIWWLCLGVSGVCICYRSLESQLATIIQLITKHRRAILAEDCMFFLASLMARSTPLG